ncbi:homoserine kinase [Methyloglobulus sp.]|uniref:homoserine kinase n=1 Tax=Methyloglobulus sp. TaxID=2518622 RepID=UPI0032B7D22F
MSVYSAVTHTQLDQFFSNYPLGEVLSYEGIQDGIDNTNYFVTTTEGEFVLTLFESLSADKLPHFVNLLLYLGKNNLPCPSPRLDKQSRPLGLLNNKQAAIFNRFPGSAVSTPSIKHCHEIGLHLGRLHRHTQNYAFPINSNHDLRWCKSVFNKIERHLTVVDRALITDELRFQASNQAVDLPKGVIHGDLFKDNVLFIDDKLSGLLDFYSAGTGILVLDLAITANDWCHDDGVCNPEKLAALLSTYERVRPLESSEKQNWPIQLRAAALRFWLSRLEHQLYPRAGAITQQKDPLVFRQLLWQYRQQQKPL